MKLKPLVILTIICLCLGIYIFLVDKNKKSTDEILQSDQSIIPFSKNAVTEISINSITFSRKQGTDEWTITEPVKSDVDNEYFQFFLSRIFDMKFIQKQKISEQELSQFEINVKNKLNMINSVTGDAVELSPGKINFDGSFFIYNKTDNHIYTVTSDIKKIFDISLYDARNKKIFKLNNNDILSFKIYRNENDIIELKKTFKSEFEYEWTIASKKNIKASWLKVNNLLDKILTLTSIEFIDNPEQNFNYGFDNQDSLKIIFELKTPDNSGNRELTVFTGITEKTKQNQIYFRINTSIPFYSVSNDIIKELKINYLDLKNEKIFGDDIKKEDISNFQIKKSNSSLSLKFENGLFSSSNNELNKNSEAINDLIHNIQLFKVTKFVSDKASDLFEFSLDKPELQIFYEIKGIKRTLNFSKKKNIFYGVIFEQQEMDIFETPPSKDGKIPEFLEPISKYIN